MPDFMTPAQRSRAMSRVRGSDTQIEKVLRSQLHQRGFRFRKNVKDLPGCPDIVLPKYRSVIFVNGCFWHHHANCARAKLPDSRREFWATKIAENVKRDKKQIKALHAQGWKVLIVWECKLRDRHKSATLIRKIIDRLGKHSNAMNESKGAWDRDALSVIRVLKRNRKIAGQPHRFHT